MQGAAIFDNAQAPCRDLFCYAMVKQYDTICHVFFEPETGHGPIAAFCSNDGCHTFILKPAEQALQFSPHDRLVWQRPEKHFNGIQYNPPGTNGIDGITQADEQSLQVVFPRLCDLTALDLDIID